MKITYKSILITVICFSHFMINAQVKNQRAKAQYFKMPAGIQETQYLHNTIIFKLKEPYKNKCKGDRIEISELNNYLGSVNAVNVHQKFPEEPSLAGNSKGFVIKQIDLSLIYEIKYSSDVSLEKAINDLYATGLVQYAVPLYIPHLLYIPNDPAAPSQWPLSNVSAFAGWDISKGSPDVVIGIVDTGTQLDHPDLKDNLKSQGWDVVYNDSNTNVYTFLQEGSHGVFVCGMASATTDNGIGMAGAGFKCKFMPIKIMDSTGLLINTYEGIKWAADHGCSVINCSWGDTIYPGPYAQELVDYATLTKNALVVAAAGNYGNSAPFYPASLNHVLSVAASTIKDEKWKQASYGKYIDVCAPGDSVYSTWYPSTYTTSSGSSFSAPIVSGLAGIVKSYFPNLNALQVGEQLKVTADNIDTIPANKPYAQQLGSGRVNLYRALTVTNLPSVNLITDSITNSSYQYLGQNDTLKLTPYFINYLSPTSSLKATLTSTSPYVQIIDPDINLGVIPTMGIEQSPVTLRIRLLPNIPNDYVLNFKLIFTDNNYSAFQNFTILVNIDYININPNFIATTLTSKGDISYNDYAQTQGIGFYYKDSYDLMSIGGLMIGNSSSSVSDNVYASSGLDNDFYSINNIKPFIPPRIGDYEYNNVFNDSLAGASKLNLTITQNTYAWGDTITNGKYIICEYLLKNEGTALLSNLYAGFYADWDIIDTANRDRADFDSNNKLGYVYSIDGGQLPYGGISLLTPCSYNYYAIDNDGSNGSVMVYNNFTKASKYITLSTNRLKAGTGANGNDVSHVLSAGPFNLDARQTYKVAFEILAGDNLADLQKSVLAARAKYGSDTLTVVEIKNEAKELYLGQNFPNPFSDQSVINIYLPEKTNMDLCVYNLLGEKVLTIANNIYNPGTYQFTLDNRLEKGIYYYSLTTSKCTLTKKMILIK